MNKIALAMIVKGSTEESVALATCLSFFKEGDVDGKFITITHKPGEARNKAVEKVCLDNGCIISDFEWCNDFSKARNFNFAQIPGDFSHILWIDADDAIRNVEHLRTTIEAHPKVDAFSMNYLYAFDEFKQTTVVHIKTQIVKNDGTFKWVGALHEDLVPNRQINAQLIKNIERIHLSDERRSIESRQRNVEVSAAELQAKSTDPRAIWNYANSLYGAERYIEAKEQFNKFLDLTNSEEEKYLAYVRLAAVSSVKGTLNESVGYARMAIGLRPYYPDAYNLLGQIYFNNQMFQKAIEMLSFGLTQKPPYYSIVVYNPRDYDFHPMMLLAKAFFGISRPDQSLVCLQACLKMQPENQSVKDMIKVIKKENRFFDKVVAEVKKMEKIKDPELFQMAYDKLSDDVRAYPGMVALRNTRIIKKESSGKDLVIYAGFTELPWSPSYAEKKGVGGSEEAVLNLSREWAKLGWNVTVYCNTGNTGEVSEGVTYKPFWMWNYRDKQDVVILWRTPTPCDYDINATKILVDLHDVIPAGEFTAPRLAKIYKVMVKTNFHRSLFPNIPDDKICVVPNGQNFDLFEQKAKKDQYLIVNTSSPDRSMDVLPKLFKKVKERVPQARCQWAYGFDVFDKVHINHSAMMKWKEDTVKAMEEAGIENLGRLSQKECAKLYLKANVLAYPTEFAEIDCITVKKAQACGAKPVTTDFGALEESVQYGVKIHSEKTKDTWCAPNQFHFGLENEEAQNKWVDAIVKELQTPIEDRSEMKEWTKKFSWNKIAKSWDSILK